MKNKGFFATVIVALLIFIALSLLAVKIEQKNYLSLDLYRRGEKNTGNSKYSRPSHIC